MEGPYSLNKENVEKYVFSKPGVYYLAYTENDKEVVYCVGRSNDNLKQHLIDFLPEDGFADETKKDLYKLYLEYASTAKSAYELECQWYHKYATGSADVHPAKTHPTWICPVCGK
jgi:hypothetical protein